MRLLPAGKPVEFDEQTCEQARLNRDARFDGRVFIGVTSTGVYCRPICPSPHARREHVQYFPTAAAAAQAGFRPCLRCRPEVAPGTPAWYGTSSTVSRGLRLIAEGALDENGIEALAERLGVTSRHLSRLFQRHLGASPATVARTRRLHFAKQLISDTSLSMAQVAMASGFGSIRRFNDAIREYYLRPPSELRRLGRGRALACGEYAFELGYRPPYDWSALLRFLSARAIPGVEAVCEDSYRRSILVRGCQGVLEITPQRRAHALNARIQLPRPELLLQVISQVRTMFDLAADPQVIGQRLGADPLLAPILRRHPGLRLPGAWDPCELVIHTLLARRYRLVEARALMGRLAEQYGEPLELARGTEIRRTFPQPAKLAAADLSCLPRAVADEVRAVAGLMGAPVAPAHPDELLDRLREAAWIDASAIEYIAMRALSDPDAFPADTKRIERSATLPSAQALRQRADGWKPWRAYASLHLRLY